MVCLNSEPKYSLKETIYGFNFECWSDRYLCGASALKESRDVTQVQLLLHSLQPTYSNALTTCLHHDIHKYRQAKSTLTKSRYLTSSLLLKAHRELMPAEREAGRYRLKQNWIGKSRDKAVYVCPPPHKIGLLLEDYFVGTNQTIQPTVSNAIVDYAKFLLIHPFHDGNGRISRILLQRFLNKLGQPVHFSLFRLGNNSSSYQTAVMSLNEDTTSGLRNIYWVKMTTWVEEYSQFIKDIQANLYSRLSKMFLFSIVEQTDLEVIRVLIDQPIVTTDYLVSRLKYDKKIILYCIDKLVAIGILEKQNFGNNYNIIYTCKYIIYFMGELYARLFERKDFKMVSSNF
jgi:Fic family protein